MNRLLIFALLMFVAWIPQSSACDLPRSDTPSAELIGKEVVVSGTAINRKMGAELVSPDSSVWIEGIDEWPPEYAHKYVQVSGILAEDHALPVIVQKPDEPPAQGIALPPGADLQEASHRYIIKNAKWVLLSGDELK